LLQPVTELGGNMLITQHVSAPSSYRIIDTVHPPDRRREEREALGVG
jgi:hypothetical protein